MFYSFGLMPTENATAFYPLFVFFFIGFLLAGWVFAKKRFTRAVQVLSVTVFVCLFWLAAYSGRPQWPVDFFLFSDPLLFLVHSMAAWVLVPLMLVSFVFVLLAVFMGRIYCSHICPLGALFDGSDRYVAKRQKAKTNRSHYKKLRKTKYVILLLVVGAAVVGLDLLGFVDPNVIITRFAAVLFYPVVLIATDVALDAARPLFENTQGAFLAYTELHVPAFEGALFFWVLLVILLGLSRLQPRFWCRHLCPLGGLLGLCGQAAPYQRRVSDQCTGCNACTRQCPTGAILHGGKSYDRKECIVCRKCVVVCQENAVEFGFGTGEKATPDQSPRLSRRGFVASVGSGLATGLGFRADLDHPKTEARPKSVLHDRLIRPPGALPESEFLTRCVRCGECMRACLTNTLQPDWYRAGLEGLWAPCLNLRHAPCEISCNVCGHVCPTQAIRPLSLTEKKHARLGTAIIQIDKCLAWAENRRCQCCDEVCPCNAIVARRDADHDVALPVVEQRRCVGCGACEEICPVLGQSAIVVVNHGEIRLTSHESYVEEALSRGYDFSGKGERLEQVFEKASVKKPLNGAVDRPGLPPGIEPAEDEDDLPLPPGISLDEEED
jgi:ferredoxin-type protein NapF